MTDVHLSIRPSSHPKSLSSNSTACGSSLDPSNLPPDLGLCLEIDPFTPEQGSLFPAQNKKLERLTRSTATCINGAGDWTDAGATSMDYPDSISQGSLFSERAKGKA